MRLNLVLSLFISAFFGVGCAGPTTPFGALNGFGKMANKVARKLGFHSSSASVRFAPGRQALHDKSNFDVFISDPQGIPENFKVSLYYNGFDMTDKFLANAQLNWVDLSHRHLKLTTKHLRLLAEKEHEIEIIYRRTPDAEPVVAEFLPPRCSAFANNRSVASIPKFEPSNEIIRTINSQANSRKFNPYMVAGLIAKESGFNPSAVSTSKAIGLTQITSLGESEVVKANPKWPRYPGIDEMSFIELKVGIYNGTIQPKNEWRLNPALSITGGVSYLSYLAEYWNKPEKKALLVKNLPDSELSEVLLASYNSGPARVSRALERNGTDWLNDEELNEARNYVRKVVSYCDHFVHNEQWDEEE